MGGGPDSHKRPRSPSSAWQESPRKKAILQAILSEELPETPTKPKASRTSAALWEQLNDANNDDDDEAFHNGQVFKFNPFGGNERSQPPSLAGPIFSTPGTTNGLTFNTPPDSASRKGKAKDKSPPVRPVFLLISVDIDRLSRRVLSISLATQCARVPPLGALVRYSTISPHSD